MKKGNLKNVFLNIILVIAIIICGCMMFFKLSFIQVEVNGISMNPYIYNGEEGYMMKTSSSTKIERFDIVAADVNEGSLKDRYWIKRVIGLPGENISIYKDKLYVNQEEVEQNFEFIESSTSMKWTLEDDQYLLFGDNRKVSAYAICTKDKIIAKGGFLNTIYNEETEEVSKKMIWDWKWL